MNPKFKQLCKALVFALLIPIMPAYADSVDNCIQQANPGRAIAACTKLLKDKGHTRRQQGAFYQLRGVAFDNKGQYKQAIADYSRAIRIRADDESHYNRGISYFKLKHYGKAIADFTSALRFNPKMVNAYYNRGTCYFHRRQLKKAIADFTSTIRLNSKHAPAYRNRAVAYKKIGQRQKAVNDYNRYMKLK